MYHASLCSTVIFVTALTFGNAFYYHLYDIRRTVFASPWLPLSSTFGNYDDSYNSNDIETIDANYLCALNGEQYKAVTCGINDIRVLAGPGSGKTRVLSSRIVHLIVNRYIDPKSILAVSFTRKASAEMKTRIVNSINALDIIVDSNKRKSINIRDLTACTLHAFCSKILRYYSKYDGLHSNYSIYDETETKKIIKSILKESKLTFQLYPPSDILSKISYLKRIGYSAGAGADAMAMGVGMGITSEQSILVILDVYKEYNKVMKASNAKDFDDLIIDTLHLLKNKRSKARRLIKQRFKHILIDEWQDVDSMQYELLLELAKDNSNEDSSNTSTASVGTDARRSLFVVGDPLQTIYSWRGANALNMEQFKLDLPHCDTYILDQNYRSLPNIVTCARYLMKNTTEGMHLFSCMNNTKLLSSSGNKDNAFDINEYGNVEVINVYNDEQQAEYIAHMIDYYITSGLIEANEIAILYRKHSQCIAIETALIARRINYMIMGGITAVERKEIKDALAYLRLLTNPSDMQSLRRIINYPPRGMGISTQKKIFSIDEALNFSGSGDDGDSASDADGNGNEEVVGESVNVLELLLALGDNYQVGTTKTATATGNSNANCMMKLQLVKESILKQLTPKQLKSLQAASSVFSELDQLVRMWEGPIEQLITEVFDKSGLLEYIRTQSAPSENERSIRLGYLQQILILARIFDSETDDSSDWLNNADEGARGRLRDCLDTFSLSSIEADDDSTVSATSTSNMQNGKVKLTSLHGSKGMEYDCVFIIGLEEGVLPIQRGSSYFKRVKSKAKKDDSDDVDDSADDDSDSHIEEDEDEERRLMYVGMTRARRMLHLTYRSRFSFGKGRGSQPMKPSKFLSDLPKDISCSRYTKK